MTGREYVLDTCSRNGLHKMAGCWLYDKRPVNGGCFVYHGMTAVDGSSVIGRALMEYGKHVLDALGIVNGPGHAEIMYDAEKKVGICRIRVLYTYTFAPKIGISVIMIRDTFVL